MLHDAFASCIFTPVVTVLFRSAPTQCFNVVLLHSALTFCIYIILSHSDSALTLCTYIFTYDSDDIDSAPFYAYIYSTMKCSHLVFAQNALTSSSYIVLCGHLHSAT